MQRGSGINIYICVFVILIYVYSITWLMGKKHLLYIFWSAMDKHTFLESWRSKLLSSVYTWLYDKKLVEVMLSSFWIVEIIIFELISCYKGWVCGFVMIPTFKQFSYSCPVNESALLVCRKNLTVLEKMTSFCQ